MSASWLLIAGGNKDAFIHLYKSHYDALFCYGLSLAMDRELTKDCIQEVFTELWKNRSTIKKEVVNERSYLFTWLRRKIHKELSRQGRAKEAFQMEAFTGTQASYEELLIVFQQSEEKREELRCALSKLSKKQMEIIRMKFFEKLSYHEIAEKLSLTPRTVYNSMYEALHNLRQTMGVLNLHPIF